MLSVVMLNVVLPLPYFIQYSVHTSIEYSAHLNFATIFGHYLVNLKPFLRYLPSIAYRQNLIIL